VGTHRRKLFRRPPILAIEAFDGSGGDPAAGSWALDLIRAIRELPRSQGEVIALRFVHGLSLEETAAALGTSIDSVKGKQARALETLRKRLDAQG
jgi:RNA polymerase sigma-70 factor (ECF subfamily)